MSTASSSSGGNVVQERPALHKWIFSKEEMEQTASRRDGMDSAEELGYRQQAASFVQELVEVLNQGVKDQRGKITQLGMCVANIHMHRFFYHHSFKKFDYRDIAAACLFLAGKSEESPRKLGQVVKIWWEKKFPSHRQFPSEDHAKEAAEYIVTLENLVLQTIAFDLNVDLPHQYVLRIMQLLDRGGHHKKIISVAYYFATDILCVMDWAIRYSCKAISVACIHIVCDYANFKLSDLLPADEKREWFQLFDEEMSLQLLKEMTNEFVNVYKSCSHLHLASLQRLDLAAGGVRGNIVQHHEESSKPMLPPPPMAPVLQQNQQYKKVETLTYKERKEGNREMTTTAHAMSQQESKIVGDVRRDNQKASVQVKVDFEETKPGVEGNGRIPSREEEDRKRREQRRRQEERERHAQSQQPPTSQSLTQPPPQLQQRHHQRERETLERLDKERQREEERRKREHDRMAGRGDFQPPGEKRSRIEALSNSFVPSSNSSTPVPTSSANHREINGDTKHPPGTNGHVSGPAGIPPRNSGGAQLAAMMKRPDRPISPPSAASVIGGRYEPKAALAPPQMHRNRHVDLEDGELE